MKTFWDPRTYEQIVKRVELLQPDSPGRWGRFTCPQMVVHITDAFALYVGELDAAAKRSPLQYAPLKHAFVYLLPIPRNVPTAPELISRVPGDWHDEVVRLLEAMSRFTAHRLRNEWPEHPVFGRLSCRAYGVLAYKHTDHHLRQFGA
jgi:hypothetical protein